MHITFQIIPEAEYIYVQSIPKSAKIYFGINAKTEFFYEIIPKRAF